MYMTDSEIVSKYQKADDKKEMLKILADLNGCVGDSEVREVLIRNGIPEEELPRKGRRKKVQKPQEQEAPEREEPLCYTEPELEIPGAITGGEGDIDIEQMQLYRSVAMLKELDPEELTEMEKERLERANSIPSVVRTVIEQELMRITDEVMELEKKRDTMIDYLEGESRCWN